jgi:CRISPR-associated endonuclease Csn1
MLQRFAKASADARGKGLEKLVEAMPDPFSTYREHVRRAISAIWVSYKPDHGYEATMHEDTAYRPPHLDEKEMWRTRGIGGNKPNEKKASSEAMLAMRAPHATRHARDSEGMPLPYKGYIGGSNYCIDIVGDENGKWAGEVISTFMAYQLVKTIGIKRLSHPTHSVSGRPLIMRLVKGDMLRLYIDGKLRLLKVTSVKKQMELFDHLDASVDSKPITKYAGSLQTAKARRVTISPIGELRDPGFKG